MSQSSHKLREQHWMSMIQQCNRESKQECISKKEWLKRNGVNYHLFYRWQQKLRNNIASDVLVSQAQMSVPAVVDSSLPQFTEVVPPKPCPISDNGFKTVLRCKSIIVELSDDISDQLLVKLIKVLSYVET
ncbi:MAG: hypothetical protein E7192_00420 [Erysipelotrichaceae bacterium]|nr:hypothetical protein [Erysipelotrichaceae bacterium]